MESPAEAANPVWHVRGRLTLEGSPGSQSCAAVLEGVIDWKAGLLRLSGLITEGRLQHAQVAAEGWLVNGDPAGILWIAPPSSEN